jgi:hypothetical protein
MGLFMERGLGERIVTALVENALNTGDEVKLLAAETLLAAGKAKIGSSLAVLNRSIYGPKRVRDIIRKYNADTASGKTNFLDTVLGAKGRQPPVFAATTCLESDKTPFRCSFDKAFDNDPSTS